MLTEVEPFKTVLFFIQFCGFWKRNSIRNFHKFMATFAFVIFEPIALILVAMSIVHIKNVSDYAKYFTFTCIFIMATAYATSFWILMGKFEGLFDDMSVTFDSKPECWVYINEVCVELKKAKFKKNIFLIICFTFGSLGSLFSGSSMTPMWKPFGIENISGFFYISWLYQSLAIYYIGILTTAFHDMFFDILNVINAYTRFFTLELSDLDLTGSDRKFKLIECVKMHQNIKRLVGEFTEIVRYPISFQMGVGAYILCTTVFTINNNDGQAGFLITLGILILIQILEPCMISQEIVTANEEFKNILMTCNWIDADNETRKLFLFFMMNLMFPLTRFSLFRIVDVDLRTFLRILNATYSTYAVLNNLT